VPVAPNLRGSRERGKMATNKRYNPALQKMRLGSASPAAVDPALNSYVLMLLRSKPIGGIDSKERPTVRAEQLTEQSFCPSGSLWPCGPSHGHRAVQSKLSIIVGLVQQMSALGEKHQKVLQALLRRICMHGHVPWNTLVPFFDAVHNQEGNPKALRVLYYLIALVLSPGSAGATGQAPLPRTSSTTASGRPQLCLCRYAGAAAACGWNRVHSAGGGRLDI
jgi:hypothetical protein